MQKTLKGESRYALRQLIIKPIDQLYLQSVSHLTSRECVRLSDLLSMLLGNHQRMEAHPAHKESRIIEKR